MADPILYGPGYSTYVRSARLALEEKRVAYRLHEVDTLSGEAVKPEHLARHPFGKVPAFEHDGFALYETSAILRYVDEAFESTPLQPNDVRARARMTQAISIIDSYAYSALITGIVIQRVVTPLLGGTPDEAVIENALPRAKTALQALETLLAGNKYLAGSNLSLADLHLIPVYDYTAQTPEGQRLLSATPNLGRWWTELGRRPSVEKTKPKLG